MLAHPINYLFELYSFVTQIQISYNQLIENLFLFYFCTIILSF